MVSALVVLGLLVLLWLLVELLVTRGELRLAPYHDAQLRQLTAPPDLDDSVAAVYRNRGLLPVVWRHRDDWRGAPLRAFYLRYAALRTNQACLLSLVLAGMALSVLFAVSQWAGERARRAAAARVARELRIAIHNQTFQLGGTEVFPAREEQPLALFTDRVKRIRQALVAWWRVVPTGLLVAGVLLAAALAVQIWLALAAILLACLGGLVEQFARRRLMRRQALWADRAAGWAALLIESLRQVRTVRGYLLPDTPGHPFASTIEHYRRAALVRDLALVPLAPGLLLYIMLAAGLMLWLTGVNVLREPATMSVGQAVVLYVALLASWVPLREIAPLPRIVQRADRAAASIFQFLEREPRVGQVPDARSLPRLTTAVRFREVTLADAEGRRTLDEVNFEIGAGSRTAIVSSDRRAVWALVNLLARFNDPAKGSVLYDGIDVRRATLDSVRRQVALVLQDGLLFTGTVAENIGCGDTQYSQLQIIDAARQACAYDFIQRLPQGFATIVGEHGMKIGPAEMLQIGLARAVLRQPALLVVEEPGDEIEPAQSAVLDKALDHAGRGRTLIVLPARLSTLRQAERVLLFHEGRLEVHGSHAELLQVSELYRHLHYLRFNSFRRFER